MRHRFAALWALSFLSFGASATTSEPTYRVECSSSAGVTRPSAGELGCDGDLRVFDGRWDAAAGSGLTITATGTLFLDNLSLSASYIVLSAGGRITLSGDVRLVADTSIEVRVEGGDGVLSIAPGASGTLSVTGHDGTRVDYPVEALQEPDTGIRVGSPGSITLVSTVPEPTTVALWLSGLALLASRWRRRLSFRVRACQHAVT